MQLSKLQAPPGAMKARKRVGRGESSGHGGTSTRGNKGQRCRSGRRIGRGFEGGQMPLQRRMPKRGFLNFCRQEFTIVHVGDLAVFEAGAVVDLGAMRQAGLVRNKADRVKVLSDGDLGKALTVRAQGFSQKAKEKIEAAGGKAEIIAVSRPQKKLAKQEG